MDGSNFSKVFHESVPCSQAGKGFELTLLQTSFAESIPPVNDSFCQVFEQPAPSEEFKNFMPPIEDITTSLCSHAQRIFLHDTSGWFGSVPLEASGDFGIEPE